MAGIKQSIGGKRTTTRMILETILMTYIMYNTKPYPSFTYMLMFSPVVSQVTRLYVLEKLFLTSSLITQTAITKIKPNTNFCVQFRKTLKSVRTSASGKQNYSPLI